MAEFDQGVKMIAETTGQQLARLAGVASQHWRPAESTLQITLERLADRVFVAGQGRKQFVVYFEFYTNWDHEAPWQMLAKSGLLSEREKLPTLCIAIVLQRQGFRSSKGQLRLEAAGGPTQQLWFKEVCLWKLTPEPWWEDEPGLMALYPLCHHGQQPQEAILHAAQAIERKVTGEVERADSLFLLHLFGGLAYSRLDVAGIIRRDKMETSQFGRELMARQQRKAILQVLRVRFGPAAVAPFTALLDELNTLTQLEPLLDAAVTCTSVEEFRRAALPAQTAPTPSRKRTAR